MAVVALLGQRAGRGVRVCRQRDQRAGVLDCVRADLPHHVRQAEREEEVQGSASQRQRQRVEAGRAEADVGVVRGHRAAHIPP